MAAHACVVQRLLHALLPHLRFCIPTCALPRCCNARCCAARHTCCQPAACIASQPCNHALFVWPQVRWASIEIQENGVANCGCPCKVGTCAACALAQHTEQLCGAAAGTHDKLRSCMPLACADPLTWQRVSCTRQCCPLPGPQTSGARTSYPWLVTCPCSGVRLLQRRPAVGLYCVLPQGKPLLAAAVLRPLRFRPGLSRGRACSRCSPGLRLTSGARHALTHA